DLFIGEHERRQVEMRVQAVADARFAVDRDARRTEIGDVPIDRALADFQPLRELRGRRQAAAAQVLNDLEESIGAPHGDARSSHPLSVAPYCQLVAVRIEKVEAPAARKAEDFAHDATA